MERGIKMDKELECDVDEFVDDFIEQQELELKEAIDELDEDDDGQQDLTLKP